MRIILPTKGPSRHPGTVQFVESPDLSDAVTNAVLGNQASHNKMADNFFADDRVKIEFVKLLGAFVHENLEPMPRESRHHN